MKNIHDGKFEPPGRLISFVLFLIVFLSLLAGSLAVGQVPDIHSDADLESLLQNKANLTIDWPDLGYTWNDSTFTGSAETGTISINATKVIYYFLHWGPIENPIVTKDYVRKRIPQIWPSEGLQVLSVNETTVAGHPAFYAEVMPQREFYRAFFLIWNCPESGRQFIADMNYNVRFRTPRTELEAEFETTYQTLACHVGAETKELSQHVVRYDSHRFGIRFDHPINWFVFENPYGVPHPQYRGRRNRKIGSLLANLQDTETDISIKWDNLPPGNSDDLQMMGNSVEHYRAAIKFGNSLEQIESFKYDDAETISLNGRKVFKLFGDVLRKTPEQLSPDFVSKARAMVVLIDDQVNNRRLQVLFLIDQFKVDGVFRRPERDIFDRWAEILADGVTF